jgi:hypothetical protein
VPHTVLLLEQARQNLGRELRDIAAFPDRDRASSSTRNRFMNLRVERDSLDDCAPAIQQPRFDALRPGTAKLPVRSCEALRRGRWP